MVSAPGRSLLRGDRLGLASALIIAAVVAASCASSAPTHRPRPTPLVSPSAAATPSPSPTTPPVTYASAPGIHVPTGFVAEVYASGLSYPTSMAFGPDGRLYVAEEGGRIVTVAPNSRAPQAFASGYRIPLGLAWLGDTLFISEEGGLASLRLAAGAASDPTQVLSGLPYGEHQQDSVVVGSNGILYIGSGSTCNVCGEASRESAAILSVEPNGSDLEVYASGVRNPYGLAVQPITGRLYASVNGQDNLGGASDPEPADMVVWVRSGADYGWPNCWPDARLLELEGSCQGVTAPAAYLAPHAAATGIDFYSGTSFPEAYWGNLFVTEWGSNFSYIDSGHVLVRVVLDSDGSAPTSGVSVFASGFQHPISVTVDPEGALLVADWGSGTIYRIQAAGRP